MSRYLGSNFFEAARLSYIKPKPVDLPPPYCKHSIVSCSNRDYKAPALTSCHWQQQGGLCTLLTAGGITEASAACLCQPNLKVQCMAGDSCSAAGADLCPESKDKHVVVVLDTVYAGQAFPQLCLHEVHLSQLLSTAKQCRR